MVVTTVVVEAQEHLVKVMLVVLLVEMGRLSLLEVGVEVLVLLVLQETIALEALAATVFHLL